MTRNNKKVPKRTEKLIYQQAGSRCVFCTEDSIALLDIHHIIPRAKGGSNEPENLILACKNCHARIESGEILHEVVMRKKQSLGARIYQMPRFRDQGSNTLNIGGDVNSSIVANSVHIGGDAKLPRQMNYPAGSIGSNLDMKNYVQHLVTRYHEFREADASYGRQRRYNHGTIHKNIQGKFKANTYFIPQERFDDVVAYLHQRIDVTIQGKVNRRRGYKSYSSFEEYVRELRKR